MCKPFLLLFLCPQMILAADWPQFRGPNRDNSLNEKNLLRSFPKDGLKILWRKPVGPGYSSPIVAGGRVYLSDSQLNNPNSLERLLCFDENTGQPLWTHSYNPAYPQWVFQDPTGVGPTSTPVAHDGKVYSFGMMTHLHCVDAKNGDLLWQKDLIKEYQGSPFSCRSSPLIEKNLLILNVGAKPNAAFIAFDKDSGKDVWKSLNEELTNASPIVISAGGQRQLIVWTQNSVSSLNPDTGQLLWREHLITDNNSAASTPIYNERDNLLLAGGIVMKLDSAKPAATVVWPADKARAKRILGDTSTPLLRGSEIFWLNPGKDFACLDATSGKELWKTDKLTPMKTGNTINLSPCGDVVFIYTDEGNLISARLTREGYKELGRAHVIDPTYPFGARKVAWAGPA
ncbi:MAG TPA: PQQ-binding-like beta-propeller repeat protein, partial [Tepidisphaeraceae bacterium]|nr:PQQ-binding-like beta-propeller repeat protein [Tepidisphaeraceae bacterium]